jgi:uroporphyrinogen III methyltransferase/synthase
MLGKRAIVARNKSEPSALSDRLRELGCLVVETHCPKIAPLINTGCILEKTLEDIKKYTWLVFTSRTGVNIFFDYLISTGFDIRNLSHLKIACVGAETEKEINKYGIRVAYHPEKYNGTALAHGLIELVNSGERLLIARAKNGAEDLTSILSSAGIAFDDVPVYEKINEPTETSAVINAIASNDFDFAAFTSSSAVKIFAESLTNIDFHKIKAVCIGERTANTAKSFGMSVFVSKKATVDSMIEKIKELSI